MPSPSDDDGTHVLPAMTLLATLSTAAEVRHVVEERRAGRDPAAQEPAGVARPYLHEARKELGELLLRLRTGLAYLEEHPEERTVVLVRRFDHLMTLNRVARLLHVIHQRLLSLYPEVSEALAEDARRLEARCTSLIEEDDRFPHQLAAFLEPALRFTADLKREITYD